MSSSDGPLEELHSFLFSILTTINYTDDKEDFIKHFFDICFAKSVEIVRENCSKEDKNTISTALAEIQNPQRVSEFLENRFGATTYAFALKKGIEETFADFFSFLSPQLSQQEKRMISENMRRLLDSGSFIHR